MSEMTNNDKIGQFENVKLERRYIRYLFIHWILTNFFMTLLGEWGRENESSYKCMKLHISLENVKRSPFRLKCFLFINIEVMDYYEDPL